ncbi:MAG: VWA domain-containing protein [Candidatus Woesearchaeota archaeon]
MIYFDHPELLYLLFVLPFVVILHLVSLIGFRKQAFKFANFETLKRLQDKENIFSKKIPELIFRLVFFIVLIFAVSGMGMWITGEGLSEEIIFAIDASGSMLATDIEPSRIDATKEALIEFIDSVPGNTKLGAISFTSLAYPQIKPTYDRRIVKSTIDDISVKKTMGTSLGAAINFGISIFEDNSTVQRKIIIFTDGQENVLSSEELLEIVKDAKEKNIKIDIIGMGSEEGAPFDDQISGYSSLKEDTLKLVTDESDGEYILPQTKETIIQALDSFTDVEQVRRPFSFSLILYILSFVLLITEWYLSNYIFRAFP